MRKRTFLYPGLLGLAVSCIGPATRPKPVAFAGQPEHVLQTNGSPETPQVVAVGGAILRVKDYWVQNRSATFLQLDRAVTIRTRKRVITLPHGAVLENAGLIELNGTPYTMYHSTQDDEEYGVIYYVKADGTFADFLYLRDRMPFPTGMEAITGVAPAAFRVRNPARTELMEDREHLDYELVFTGKDAEGIHLTYREFSPGAPASPTFQEDLTYPAGTQRVAYKNVQFRINGCTGTELTYTPSSED